MNPLFVAAAEIQDVCREREWGFCFIGGLAAHFLVVPVEDIQRMAGRKGEC